MLADQMLNRIQKLHSDGYLHRNIRPENFLMGQNDNKSTLYLIDFGLAKSFLKHGAVTPFRKGRCMTGTLRYSSVNSQCGFEQARRDDLESIGYMLIYFLKGELPWQNISARSKDELYKKVLTMKLEITVGVLTKGLPEEFKEYLSFVRCMDYEPQPNYGELREMFQKLFKKKGFSYDNIYDWEIENTIGNPIR